MQPHQSYILIHYVCQCVCLISWSPQQHDSYYHYFLGQLIVVNNQKINKFTCLSVKPNLPNNMTVITTTF
jgi:hypothetical protein